MRLWPWNREGRPPEADKATVERLESLERAMKLLRADWADWEDRLGRLYDRSRKAVKKRLEQEDAEPAQPQPHQLPLGAEGNGADPRAAHKADLRRMAAQMRGVHR